VPRGGVGLGLPVPFSEPLSEEVEDLKRREEAGKPADRRDCFWPDRMEACGVVVNGQ